MKQAVQERFILDVLEHYTPVDSYYRLSMNLNSAWSSYAVAPYAGVLVAGTVGTVFGIGTSC